MSEQHVDKSVVTPKTSLHIKKVTLPFILLNAPVAYIFYQININQIGIDLSFLDDVAPSIKYLAQPDNEGRSNRLYYFLVWAIGYFFVFRPAFQEGPNTNSQLKNIDPIKSVGVSLFFIALAFYVYFFALTEKTKYSGRDGIVPLLVSEGPAGVGLLLSVIVWFFYVFLIILVAHVRKAIQHRRNK